MLSKRYGRNRQFTLEVAEIYGKGLMQECVMPPGFASLKKKLMRRGKLGERMASYLAAVLRMNQVGDKLEREVGRKGLGCDLLRVPVWKTSHLAYVDIARKYARGNHG